MEAILIVLVLVLAFLYLKNNQNETNQSAARRYFEETEFDFKPTINEYSHLISDLDKYFEGLKDGTAANSLIISQTLLLESTIEKIKSNLSNDILFDEKNDVQEWDIYDRNMKIENNKVSIDEILINAVNFNYKNIWNVLHEAPLKKEVNYQFLRKIRKTLEPPQVKPLNVNDIDVYVEHPPKPSIENYEKRLTNNYNTIRAELREKWELEVQERHFQAAYSEWEKASVLVDKINLLVKERYEEYLKVKESFEDEFQKFNIYRKKQTDELRRKYSRRDLEAIIEYHTLILKLINYPETFPQNFIIEYSDNNQIMVIDFSLPALEDIPTLKEVKVVRGYIKEYHLSERQMLQMYDEILYSIALRTIYIILKSDTIEAIKNVTFNGWVDSINKANGKRENKCILSIQASKEEFLTIDLAYVDPKTCFKNLKGISGSKLSNLTPVRPILQISTSDRRFVDHYEVADVVDESTNLAAMDWKDFENLIREIFEKEFSSNGGEVKITQASKDGGVDAIAFDPDPIRGGKIVIQAKRYTNLVSVSAVRDLYGTVMNEGALKGILVTTADYGPDSYEFAKNKPITLLNGANLLHLLEKYGHRAKIDIQLAKDELKTKNRET